MVKTKRFEDVFPARSSFAFCFVLVIGDGSTPPRSAHYDSIIRHPKELEGSPIRGGLYPLLHAVFKRRSVPMVRVKDICDGSGIRARGSRRKPLEVDDGQVVRNVGLRAVGVHAHHDHAGLVKILARGVRRFGGRLRDLERGQFGGCRRVVFLAGGAAQKDGA